MSDGLEWLICDEPCKVMDARSGCHCAKARDEIERLKAEIERLRVTLEDSEKRFAVLRAAYDKERKKSILLQGSAALEGKQ